MTPPDPSFPDGLTIALPSDLSSALDRALQSGNAGSTREEALVHGFRQWATTQGYVSNDDGAMRPEDLNAANDD